MRILKAVIAVFALAAPAQAEQGSPVLQLDTLDATKQWQGVGRLNIGRIGFCTGTLVAPDLVLTAAHCLYDLETGERADDDEIEFLAGWRDGRASAYRGVRQSVIHSSYEFRGREDPERVGSDIALLQLDQPIRNAGIRPFETGHKAPKGQVLKIVSYARHRANAPSLQDACHVLETDADLYVTSCDVDFGASGAPIFVMEDGNPRIMSVVSAKAEWNQRKVSLAVGVQNNLKEMKVELVSRAKRRPRFANDGERLRFNNGVQPSGARFVRP
jgi:V8-like Glu-specific endopeptidase